jgi:hypothetical protein
VQSVDLEIDVSDAAGLGEPATVAVTVSLPDPDLLGGEPVVCFAKPGGGYSKEYFTVDLPGPGHGAQAEWHARRGWIFVSCDHLGVGASSTKHDPGRLDYTTVAAASQAADQEVLRRLADRTLLSGFPSVRDPLLIGIGQSMGGCMTVIQQGRYHCYDGIGVLGYSAVHTHPPVRPGDTPIVAAWLVRDTLLREPVVIVNAPQLAAAERTSGTPESGPAMGWGFHYSDVDPDLIAKDLVDFPTRNGDVPPWGSATLPGAVAASCLTPGAIAPEAAAVLAPVLVGMGERDVIADPKGEPRAYLSASSVDLFICPHMGHMHNFASTRELFWERLDTWAAWVRISRSANPK